MESLLLLMAPVFPHISEELWHVRGREASIHLQQRPQAQPGPKRGRPWWRLWCRLTANCERLQVAPGTSSVALEAAALAHPNVLKWMEGKAARQGDRRARQTGECGGVGDR